MWVYIGLLLVFGITTILTTKNKKEDKKKIQFVIYYIAISLLLILRSDKVGSDTRGYIDIYYNIQNIAWVECFDYYYEPLFVLINKIFSSIGLSARDFTNLFIITILLFNFIAIYKYADNFNIGILIYVCLCFNYIYLLRQAMAIAIIFLAFKYVKEHKIVKYFIAIIIASLFHIAALLGVLIYFVYNVKNTKILTIITFISAILILTIPDQISLLIKNIFDILQIDRGIYLKGGSISINMVLVLLISVVFVYFIIGHSNGNFNLVFLAIMGQMLSPIFTLASRISVMFWPYLVLLISEGYSKIAYVDNREIANIKNIKECHIRQVLFMFFIMFYIFYWFYTMWKGSSIGGYFIPYYFIWEI